MTLGEAVHRLLEVHVKEDKTEARIHSVEWGATPSYYHDRARYIEAWLFLQKVFKDGIEP